jgi:ubiquinone/menaquinone biosynthesis C-methylase UbiE
MTAMKTGHGPDRHIMAGAARHLEDETARRADLRRHVELVRRFAPPGPWLDVGCGTGILMALAREALIEIDGIELSPGRRAIAIQIANTAVYDQPLEALNLPENSRAAVTLINVFSHLVNPTETLAEIHRVLVPGGVVLLHTSEIGPGAQRHHIYHWDLGEHLYYLGNGTAEFYAKKLGYAIVHHDRMWLPATVYTRNRFTRRGRSRLRNAVKALIVYSGALLILRWYMLNLRQAGNPVYTANLVLRKA